MLVVVPVLLMLGSVYTHATAANLGQQVTTLEERRDRAEVERENLEVRLAELSAPGRIRTLATEERGMRDPGGAALKVYGSNNGEDSKSGPGRVER